MRRKMLLGLMALSLSSLLFANNITVTSVSTGGQNTANGTTFIRFNLSWENSWRVTASPANWDAAWVFVKYRTPGGAWQHASLGNGGHVAPSGSTIETGLRNPSTVYNAATNPGAGVFVYRSAAGSGTFTATNVQLLWNYAADGLSNNANVDVQVYAIEMVYVPQGAFQVGSGTASGSTEADPFYTYPSTSTPYPIGSEAAIAIGTGAGQLYYDDLIGAVSGDNAGPVPADFPKGFKAFYAMKHEISQQAYVDFLNTLTRAQQGARVATNISGTSITNRYVLTNTTTMVDRSAIRCDATVGSGPITFYCDADGDGIGGENNDGLGLACNYLSWGDVAAYLDWAALRPMTELEFEKAARGTATPVAGEYVWGTLNLANALFLANQDQPTETVQTGSVSWVNHTSNEPRRVGMYARPGNNREASGASFYGILDLAGSSMEVTVTVGTATGRAFTGLPGDGSLSAGGEANTAAWPTTTGMGGRGGANWSVSGGNRNLRTSDRRFGAELPTINRSYYTGGRGVR